MLLVLCAGCGAKAPGTPPPPVVSVAVPLQRQVVDWDDYVGRFEAPLDAEIRPRVSGNIVEAHFEQGRRIAKGAVLFVIDPRPYRAAADQARAQVTKALASAANARTELARADTLRNAKAISIEEYETKLANLRTAEADVAAARADLAAKALDLSFTAVRAPIDGLVSDRRVSVGNFVTAGQTVLTRVVSTNPIWFSFDGAETFYLKYVRAARLGQRPSSRYAANPVQIQLADESDYRWQGRMSFVDNAIDPQSGTIRAHAVVANPDGFLVPGMFGRARLLGSGTYRALLVPDEAIVTDQTRRSVMVVGADGKTAVRLVETGPMVEGLRVIKSGITAQDRVVINGLTRLQPGSPVTLQMTKIAPRATRDAPVSTPLTAPAPAEATTR